VPDQVAGPHEVYRRLLEQDVLGFQACEECAAAVFPPRGRCSRCGADALQWRSSAGRGAVYSATVLSPRGETPYAVVLVDLDEGFRMMSRVDGGVVAIGDRVLVQVSRSDGEPLPIAVLDGGK
jgi:uncharacterized OB-fold protein